MTRSDILELLKTLSFVEGAFVAAGIIDSKMPDYLSDRINNAIKLLTTKIYEC